MITQTAEAEKTCKHGISVKSLCAECLIGCDKATEVTFLRVPGACIGEVQ